MTSIASALEHRRTMDNLSPEAQGGVAGAAIMGILSLAGLWVRSKFADRADERETLLEAYKQSQHALNELRRHVGILQGHLDNANLLIADLMKRERIATEER